MSFSSNSARVRELTRRDMITKVEAQIFFLWLSGRSEPALSSGPEIRTALEAYLKEVNNAISDGTVTEDLIGYARMQLSQLEYFPKLHSALRVWAAKFHLQTDWCLDHALEVLARHRVLVINLPDDSAMDPSNFDMSWWGAVIKHKSLHRSASFGPEVEFTFTFSPDLTPKGVKPLMIHLRYRNPWKILREDFLADVKKTFARYVLANMRNARLLRGRTAKWDYLKDIADETLRFNEEVASFVNESRAKMKLFIKSIVKSDSENERSLWHSVQHARDGELERNLHWLVQYQILKRSYGEIVKAENLSGPGAVISGTRAAAKFIGLPLRRTRNTPGRKKASETDTGREKRGTYYAPLRIQDFLSL